MEMLNAKAVEEQGYQFVRQHRVAAGRVFEDSWKASPPDSVCHRLLAGFLENLAAPIARRKWSTNSTPAT